MDHRKLTEKTEKTVQKYFEDKDWSVVPIDKLLKKSSSDFFIYNDSFCFLCEVKTVISDKANIPDLPKYYFDEKRSQRQAEAEEFQKSNPGKSLVYLPHWYDFTWGDDAEFRKKYSDNPRRRNLRYHFENNFVKLIQDAFANSNVGQLPYHLTIYSNDLYIPTKQERDNFFEWLEGQLRAIHEGKSFDWRWVVQDRIDKEWIIKKHGAEYLSKIYSATYTIHVPIDGYDLEATLNLMIQGPIKDSCLELHFDYFEMINLDKIRSTIAEGVGQLESVATVGKEIDQRINETIPRIIVLSFRTGIGSPDDWGLLIECIKELLKENCTKLSGITVLDWIWANNTISPSFIMFHNSHLQEIQPFPKNVFANRDINVK
jgi:hypothetical protein